MGLIAHEHCHRRITQHRNPRPGDAARALPTDRSLGRAVDLCARPGASLRAASIDIKNRLAELERRVASEGPPERAQTIHEEITRLAAELKRLTDPEERGRGRILFAAIGDGWVRCVSTQLPVPSRVVLDRSAFIHPFLELLDVGGPAGVVLASRTEARLLEWRLGELIALRQLRAA
jgi:hypothetical protein